MPLEDFCVNHPDRTALEQCEVCGNPLCGYCLYYTDDGQRLCERHAEQAKANGVAVFPPAVYADGIIPAQAFAKENADLPDLQKKGALDKRAAIYVGNNHDLGAFVSMLLGLTTIGMCCGATYCVPFVAFGLGIAAFVNAQDAVDAGRVRQQALVGIVTGGGLVVAIVACIALYVVAYGSLIAAVGTSSSSTSPFFFPTSTVTPAPFSTSTPIESGVSYHTTPDGIHYQVTPTP
jgi:hypothetical protein